ncbi:efflux RND transporter periplasmic adaptor subunit [Hymenobacter sp. BRD128]|uniref:efflux RND transporter periplasmic adaptor subunit n=1 Tax=Hymenobacter sp. BRD128 TaxID=2675878 RepID=UPI001567B719|nr:efflux RND transporter periplasmic adaptor subunit [Hymenobacter sp. BRD128]QKG58450.1 efflux RND transporter periplasmic adaptor subunit [Hymenobacter sp. BRD128]
MTRLSLSFRPARLLTLATLLAAPTLLLSGCGSSGDAEQATAKTPAAASPAAPAAYAAVQVTAAPPAQALSLPGELESFYQTDITPRVSAYVRRVNVDIGDHVRAGQVLAELDAPELTAALNEALSKQKAAEATAQGSRGSYRRLRQTARTAGAVSPLAVDQARTLAASDSLAVVAARAHYRAAAQMAAYLRLTAPFAGTITERTAAPGALVSQGGAALFKLKQLSPLRLRVAVPETYVGQIKDGNPVQFTVRAFPGRTFTGKLTRTAGSVQAATRSEQVELDIPNPKEELKPGMFASASLPVQARANSLFVPKSAVVNTAERTYLIRVADGRTELVDVQLGDENAGQVQVFGKLRAGDVVLKSGNEEITARQPVQVTMR